MSIIRNVHRKHFFIIYQDFFKTVFGEKKKTREITTYQITILAPKKFREMKAVIIHTKNTTSIRRVFRQLTLSLKMTCFSLISLSLLLVSFPLVDSDDVIGINCQIDEPPDKDFEYQLDSCEPKIRLNTLSFCYIPNMDDCLQNCPGLCTESQATFAQCRLQYQCIWILARKTTTISTSTSSPVTTPTPGPGISNGLVSIIIIIVIVIICIVATIGFFLYKKFRSHPHQNLVNIHYRVDNDISFRNSSTEFIQMDQLDGNGSENLNPLA